MDFVPVAAMMALIIAIINLVKYIRAGDTNGVVTTVSVWVAGVIVVLLVGQTDFAEGIVIADRAMSDYNTWSLIFIGLSVAATAQFANELKTAFDRTDTAVKPDLVSGDKHPRHGDDVGAISNEFILGAVVVAVVILLVIVLV